MSGSMTADLVALLPEGILVLGAVVCLLLGSWTPRTRQHRVRTTASLVVAVSLALSVRGHVAGPTTAFSETVVVDGLTTALRLVVGGSLLVLLLLAGTEARAHPRESEVAVLLLLGGAGVVLLGSATDTVVLLVAFLLSSIPLYGLVGLSSGQQAPEAALKTYLVGAICGIWLMLGTALLLGLTGSTAYSALHGLDDAPAAAAVAGVALVLVGLLFKAGAVPAHFWVPDAVEASWVTSAAFLTTVPKLGATVAVVRLLEALPGDGWPVLVGVLAVVTMTVGNLAALGQTGVRRLLAWSTISQVGYLLAVAAAVPGTDAATGALALFLAGYAITNLGCFAVVAAQPGRTSLEDWTGAGRRDPVLVGSLGILLLGLVGTPPTAVFVAKLLALAVTWDAGLPWLAVAIAVNTVISLAYYLRWLALTLRSNGGDGDEAPPATSARSLAVACALLAVVGGLAAAPVVALGG